MPDAFSDAIKEAYASVPTTVVVYDTLELHHPAFVTPIRVFHGIEGSIEAKLEATAPVNPGALVTFVGYALQFSPPQQSSDSVPTCTIEIDNVSPLIMLELSAAVSAGEPVSIIYRQYISDSLTEGPEVDPPIQLEVISVTGDVFRLKLTAGFPNLMDRRFPLQTYDLSRFPGLTP